MSVDPLFQRLVAIHTMLDPKGTSLKSTEELVSELASERDRAWKTITEIETALTEHGVAITAPLSDAILPLLYEREQNGTQE